MKTYEIDRVLVIHPENPKHCVGIVTRSDVLRYIEIIGVKKTL
ncbi:MAG: CBS domain-containing protein [Candidatus Hermodarchaeota archaeon]